MRVLMGVLMGGVEDEVEALARDRHPLVEAEPEAEADADASDEAPAE